MDTVKLDDIVRIREELAYLRKVIEQDNEDGYLLRPYLRRVIEDKIEFLTTQERNILKQ
jgi:hypothetical protein